VKSKGDCRRGEKKVVILIAQSHTRLIPPAPKKRNIFRIFYRASIGQIIARACHDQIPNMGCVIETRSPLVVPRIKAKLFLRGYEPVEIDFVKRYLHSDRDVIDLGSSLGVVASHVGRKLHAGRRVICVEANPQLLDIIRANVTRNAPHVQVEIVSGAVDYPPDRREFVELALGFDNLVAHIVEDEVVPQGIFVPVVSLSEIIRRYEVAEYTLVSDIEGSEAGLLEMDDAALTRCRQMIIELHHTVRHERIVRAEELAAELRAKHGFRQIDRRGMVYVFEK
jgi:FkbM family methyltransferase